MQAKISSNVTLQKKDNQENKGSKNDLLLFDFLHNYNDRTLQGNNHSATEDDNFITNLSTWVLAA